MTQDERNELTKLITNDIEYLKNEIQDLEEKLQPVARDCSLCNVTRAEALNEQEIDAKILLQTENRLEKLEHALKNIDEDTFGICQMCDEDINIERLKILPESTICIECANNH